MKRKDIAALNAEWDAYYRHSFRNFLYLVWHNVEEIRSDPTLIQYDIANHLQYGSTRTCIEALRGLGKSYITCAYAAWRLRNDPSEAILITSANINKAKKNCRFIRDIIYNIDIMKPLRLTDAQRRDRSRKYYDSVLMFDVNGAGMKQVPSVNCVGIEGQVTGDRATLIICDDIEVSTNSLTKTQRAKIELLVTEFDAVIKPGKGNRIIYLGTPHSIDSLYNTLPKKGYDVKMWPAEVPDNAWLEYYGQHLGDCIQEMVDNGVEAGTPTDSRFDKWDLMQRKASMGTKYPQQYMLDIRESDANRYPLKLRDLIVTDLDHHKGSVHLAWSSSPELIWQDLDPICSRGDACYRPFRIDPRFQEYEDSIMVVDPSGAGEDMTAICVMKLLHGRLFCTELIGLKGGYSEEVLKEISELAKYEKVNKILIETNMGGGGDRGGMFGELLRPVLIKYHHCAIEGIWNHRQKELRICDTLEPVFNNHRLIVDKAIITRDADSSTILDEEYRLCYQITSMTREKGAIGHDDLIDALAMAVGYFEERLAISSDEALNKYQDDQWEEMLRQFEEMAGNSNHSNDSAFSTSNYNMTCGLN